MQKLLKPTKLEKVVQEYLGETLVLIIINIHYLINTVLFKREKYLTLGIEKHATHKI